MALASCYKQSLHNSKPVCAQELVPKGWSFTEVKQKARAVFDLFL